MASSIIAGAAWNERGKRQAKLDGLPAALMK